MRDELKNIANIEEYLAGGLSSEQALIIENKIKSDAAFAQNVNAQREITNHFKVRAFSEAVQVQQVKYNRVRLVKSILIVLTALALIGFAVYQFFPSSEMASTESDPIPTAELIDTNNKITQQTFKGSQVVNPTSTSGQLKQKSASTQIEETEQSAKIDSSDNTVGSLSLRNALMISPKISNGIVDINVDDSSPQITPVQERTIWKIEDRFIPYYKDMFIPIKVASSNKDLNLTYSFTAVRGSEISVTLIDPNGKEIEVLNMTEKFEDLQLEDQLELEHVTGRWKMKIKTIGQGYFSMQMNSNE